MTAVLLAGCPSDSSIDAADGTEGDLEDTCDPGSPLLDNTKAASDDAQPVPCATGWAADAPQLSPTWTIELPTALEVHFPFSPVQVDAHPDGGVVVAGTTLFARFDADGNEVWSLPDEIPPLSGFEMVVEEAGTVVLYMEDWARVNRYAADGTLIGEVPIPWNAEHGFVWSLATNGPELLVAGFDTDAQGNWEHVLLRLDANDDVLLRKSTSMTNVGPLAVNDNGTAVFGSSPTYMLALDNGAVLGSLIPSNGVSTELAGYGSDFVMAGSAAGNFSVGRYSETGAEQWLRTYDPGPIGGSGQAIDIGPDGRIVAAGATPLFDTIGNYQYNTQPFVVGIDADGDATWADRISAVGEASSVAFGSNGEVYVVGGAELLDDVDPPLIAWLRRYDPCARSNGVIEPEIHGTPVP